MAAQKPDLITIDGETRELYSNPLEELWTTTRKKRPNFFRLDSCTRGYIASWEIRNDVLYLTGIEGDVERRTIFFSKKNVKYGIKDLFPKCPPNKGVVAKWFTGKLRIPQGNMTQYEDTGYDSRFEQEMIITVDAGKILKKRILDYTQKTLIVSS